MCSVYCCARCTGLSGSRSGASTSWLSRIFELSIHLRDMWLSRFLSRILGIKELYLIDLREIFAARRARALRGYHEFSNCRFICVICGYHVFLSRILGIKELYLIDLHEIFAARRARALRGYHDYFSFKFLLGRGMGCPQAPLFNKELRNSQAAKSHAYPQMMQIKFFNSYNS